MAGPPGAGKTTIASEVVQRLNKLWPQKASSMDSQVNPADVAAVLPMDGFHLYRSQLDSMEVSYTSIFPESPWLFCLNNFHMIRKPSDFFLTYRMIEYMWRFVCFEFSSIFLRYEVRGI